MLLKVTQSALEAGTFTVHVSKNPGFITHEKLKGVFRCLSWVIIVESKKHSD